MKAARRYQLVLVTAPDLRCGRRLARAALKARLVACASLVRGIESHYWWRGTMQKSAEVLLLMKTTRTALGTLEKLIVAGHPYDTPEFVVLDLVAGNRKYLDWLGGCVQPKKDLNRS